MLNYLSRATLDLLLLRRGPQDLPARRNLLLSVIAVFVFVSAAAYVALMDMNFAVAVMQSMTGLGYLAGFIWVVLAVTGRKERFVQTFMALTLTGTVFNILEVGPLSSLMPYFLQMQEVMQQAQVNGGQVDAAAVQNMKVPGLPMVLLLLGYGWRLVVMAHILHHALEVSRGRAMAITLIFPAVIMFLALMLR